jgi:hypothetical protein
VAWKLIVALEWPAQGTDFQALIREVVDPLHRENVVVYGVSLEQQEDA